MPTCGKHHVSSGSCIIKYPNLLGRSTTIHQRTLTAYDSIISGILIPFWSTNYQATDTDKYWIRRGQRWDVKKKVGNVGIRAYQTRHGDGLTLESSSFCIYLGEWRSIQTTRTTAILMFTIPTMPTIPYNTLQYHARVWPRTPKKLLSFGWAMMGHDGLWWAMMGYDGLWWAMMGYDGLWWVMMGYDGFQSRSFKRGSRGFDGLRSSWWLLSFQWLQFLGQFYGVLDVSTCLNMNIIQETLENHNKTIPFLSQLQRPQSVPRSICFRRETCQQ